MGQVSLDGSGEWLREVLEIGVKSACTMCPGIGAAGGSSPIRPC
jgi:hypothetical protein